MKLKFLMNRGPNSQQIDDDEDESVEAFRQHQHQQQQQQRLRKRMSILNHHRRLYNNAITPQHNDEHKTVMESRLVGHSYTDIQQLINDNSILIEAHSHMNESNNDVFSNRSKTLSSSSSISSKSSISSISPGVIKTARLRKDDRIRTPSLNHIQQRQQQIKQHDLHTAPANMYFNQVDLYTQVLLAQLQQQKHQQEQLQQQQQEIYNTQLQQNSIDNFLPLYLNYLAPANSTSLLQHFALLHQNQQSPQLASQHSTSSTSSNSSSSSSSSSSSQYSKQYQNECDKVDEHFRRSLGVDYVNLCSNSKLNLNKKQTRHHHIIEPSTPSLSMPSMISQFDVDEHFSKALGTETWKQLKRTHDTTTTTVHSNFELKKSRLYSP